MRSHRRQLHLWVVSLVIVAMALALTPAVADPLPGTEEYPNVVFLSRNDVPFDSLGAGAIAAQLGAPVIITPPSQLSDAARDAIRSIDPEVIVVAGGVFAISEQVAEDAAKACEPDCVIDRRFGAGRDETAAALTDVPGDYGFGRPVLTGDNQVVGDVHIGGDLQVGDVVADDLTYRSPVTRTSQVTYMDFRIANSKQYSHLMTNGISAHPTDEFDPGMPSVRASVSVPDAVTVRRITFHLFDSNDGHDLFCGLFSSSLTSNASSDHGFVVSSGSGGYQQKVLDDLAVAVDTDSRTYLIDCFESGGGQWNTHTMRVVGAIVEYTTATP